MSRVLPGAESFAYHGGPIGFLLIHGFTGSPGGLRQIGDWLAARGHTVVCPRLPGHGTTWQQLGRTRWQDWSAEATRGLKDIDGRVESVIVFGLSFGSVVALHLAARYPDAVRGLVLVNPWLKDRRREMARYLKYVMRSGRGILNDIKKPGQDEVGYERVPVKAVAQAAEFQRLVRRELDRVRQPVLVFQSTEDHAIPPGSSDLIMQRLGSADKEVIELTNSYHVATLDHDAELIFERTHEFAEAHAIRVDHSEEPLEEEEASDEPLPAEEASDEPLPAEEASEGSPHRPPDEAGPEPDDREQEPG